MQQPLINILIRTHRPEQYLRCLRSVEKCGYDNKIVHVMDGTGRGENYDYNLMCNELKAEVKRGWFFFLDDDDTLIYGALDLISLHLTDPGTAIVVPFLRGTRPKPRKAEIKRGHCGLPNLILHSDHKHTADVTAHAGGDYDWIKAVTDKVPWRFVNIPLVSSPKRSYGK